MDPRENALTQESLLEHAVWLRRLASELVRDPGAAEDLVQDTWLAALRSKPDPSRPLRPWLARVMRNGATQRLRRAAGRLAKESEAARPEAVPSARELVERAEQQRHLVDAVLTLPEPYREVLLLRYYEGLSPAQIAESLQVPPATVRTQLHRGIHKLRERLDRDHGGDRKAWVLMLQPLATPIPGAAAPAALAAGLLVATVAILGAVGMGLGWWGAPTEEPNVVRSNSVQESNESSAQLDPGNRALRQPVGPVADPATERRVQLTNARTGQALAHFELRAGDQVWVSDGQGYVTLPGDVDRVQPIDHGGLALSVGSNHRPRQRRAVARRVVQITGGESTLAIAVGPTYRLRVTGPVVFDWADLRASLQSKADAPWQEASVRGESGGAWVRFADVPEGAVGEHAAQDWRLVVRHASGLWIGQVAVGDVVQGSPSELAVPLRSVARLSGRIEGADNLHGVQISVRSELAGRASRWTLPAGDGSYSIAHMEPGAYTMDVTSPMGRPWTTRLELAPGETLEQPVELVQASDAGRLAGTIHSQTGAYDGQLLVFLRDGEGRTVNVFPTTWRPGEESGSVAHFAFEAVPFGPLDLDVVSLAGEVGFRVEPAQPVAPDEGVKVTLLDREPASDWIFEVVDAETGEPLESVDVRYRRSDGWPRRFLGEASRGAWTWTRIAGDLRWNEFEGAAPLQGLASDAGFAWSVRAEGYAPVSGDQAAFDTNGDGSRHLRVALQPGASESQKTE